MLHVNMLWCTWKVKQWVWLGGFPCLSLQSTLQQYQRGLIYKSCVAAWLTGGYMEMGEGRGPLSLLYFVENSVLMSFFARQFIFHLVDHSPQCTEFVMVFCHDRWHQQIFVPLYLDNH